MELPETEWPDDEVLAHVVESGWEYAAMIRVGSRIPYRLLFYSDTDVRFEHKCDRRASRNAGIIVCAPRLTNVNQPGGHQITGTRERPTVRASILCDDCGTHGFITDGQWAGT